MIEVGDIIKCKRGRNEIIFRLSDLDELDLFKNRCDSVELVQSAKDDKPK